jgi:hypothetical protein
VLRSQQILLLGLDLPHYPGVSSYLSQNPTNPTIAPVFGVGKAILGVGLRIPNPTKLARNPTKRMVRCRVKGRVRERFEKPDIDH